MESKFVLVRTLANFLIQIKQKLAVRSKSDRENFSSWSDFRKIRKSFFLLSCFWRFYQAMPDINRSLLTKTLHSWFSRFLRLIGLCMKQILYHRISKRNCVLKLERLSEPNECPHTLNSCVYIAQLVRDPHSDGSPHFCGWGCCRMQESKTMNE